MESDSSYRKTISDLAHSYYEPRFPKASPRELAREINDWITKIDKSRGVVKDFTHFIGDPHGKKILDCGSGSGGLTIAFSEAGAEMHGVDIEEELVNIAKTNIRSYNQGLKAEFVLYDGQKLPFDNDSFDSALSVSVLEHVDDPVSYLAEIHRTLKTRGRLLLAFPNRLWPKETHTGLWGLSYFSRGFASFLARLFRRNPIEANNLHFYSYLSLKHFIQTLRVHGSNFEIQEDNGKSRSRVLLFIKKMLNSLGLSYKMLLPHIIVVLEKV
jgi:ubiquinone/menaquinone biosynthesis C-methylase UbiE